MAGIGGIKTGLGSVPTAGEVPSSGSGGTVSTDASLHGDGSGGSPLGVNYGTAPPLVASTSSAGVASTAARSDHTHGSTVADWTIANTRYFAVDGTVGNDTNAGFSDVSQAAAGAVAVRTLARLLQILPKFGAGRKARVAIRSTNYASDTTFDLSGFSGYNQLVITGTDTVASAGATAFAGDANDGICAGMTTATGMNAAGYNSTAYSVAADGTPTITLQLNGGGAPGFGANPNRPYRCRLRWDAATTTAALRNTCHSIIFVSGGNQLILSQALAANPVGTDVCYIEMPGVTGPTTTLAGCSGQGTGFTSGMTLVGLSLGAVRADAASIAFAGCEATTLGSTKSSIVASGSFVDTTVATRVVGTGLFTTSISTLGGRQQMFDSTHSNTAVATFTGSESFLWERSSSGAQFIFYNWAQGTGNNNVVTVGTNSSTVHGATCQLWGTIAAPAGTTRCGMYISAGIYGGRVKFSNMGANPAAVLNGSGFGSTIQGFSGAAADGNTDVGLSLQPAGLSGNTVGAMGCTLALVGSPSVTGTTGDVRLPNGTITTWAALLATGMTDTSGNRIVSSTSSASVGSPPLGIIFNGTGQLHPSGVGATFSYTANPGVTALQTGALLGVNEVSNQFYRTSARLITRMRVTNLTNSPATTAYTVTLYKNNVATAMTLTVPAGSAAGAAFADLAHPVLFADGDAYDVRADIGASGDGTNAYWSVTLEGP